MVSLSVEFVSIPCHSWRITMSDRSESVYVLESHEDIVLGELYKPDENGDPRYIVMNGIFQKVFKGETAHHDAQRLFYDFVIPVLHGGKWK
jgi:hypothetical protein